MIIQSLIFTAFLGFFTSSAVAIYALIMNPRNHVNRSWARLSLFVGLMSCGWGMIIASHSLPEADLWLKVCFIGGFFVPSAYLDFTYNFLDIRDRRLIISSYLLSFIFLLVYLSGHTVDLIYNQVLGFYYWKARFFYDFYALHLTCAAVFGVYLLYKGVAANSGIKKAQTIYVFIASILAFPCGITALLPAYLPVIPFGFYPFFLYPLFIAYAMIKYRLMDVAIVIRKSLVYTLVIGLFTGMYISALFFIGQFLQRLTGGTYLVLTFLMIIVFALVFQPLKDLLQIQIDKRFFREKYDYQKTLKELSHAAASVIDLDALLKLVTKTIVERINIGGTSIYVLDDSSSAFALKEEHLQKEGTPFMQGKKRIQSKGAGDVN